MLRRAFAPLLCSLLASAAVPAAAQVQRNFPESALRGALTFGVAPDVVLNGDRARLAPGVRIRDTANMAVVPSALFGSRYLVHYTIDSYGLVKDVWILTPAEAARKPWPTTPREAQAWRFDPGGQTWTKP